MKYQEALERVRLDFEDRIKTENILMVGRLEIDILEELVDKQTPKKPIIENDFMFYEEEMYEYIYLICPNCNSKLSDEIEDIIFKNIEYYKKDYYNQDINFCHCCGQKLDWSLLDEVFCKEVKE
ncbi:MAG: hypothetical protein ACOYEB_07375 [Enterococcus lemanii]|jgi:uncharacterized protein with PIN domain